MIQTGAGMLKSDCAPKQSEVSETIEALYCAIQYAEDQTGMLFDSISAVVRSPSPQPCEGNNCKGYETDLACKINTAANRIRGLAEAVSDMRHRVEL